MKIILTAEDVKLGIHEVEAFVPKTTKQKRQAFVKATVNELQKRLLAKMWGGK